MMWSINSSFGSYSWSWLRLTGSLKSSSSFSLRMGDGWRMSVLLSSRRSKKACTLTLMSLSLLTSMIGKHTKSGDRLVDLCFLTTRPWLGWILKNSWYSFHVGWVSVSQAMNISSSTSGSISYSGSDRVSLYMLRMLWRMQQVMKILRIFRTECCCILCSRIRNLILRIPNKHSMSFRTDSSHSAHKTWVSLNLFLGGSINTEDMKKPLSEIK